MWLHCVSQWMDVMRKVWGIGTLPLPSVLHHWTHFLSCFIPPWWNWEAVKVTKWHLYCLEWMSYWHLNKQSKHFDQIQKGTIRKAQYENWLTFISWFHKVSLNIPWFMRSKKKNKTKQNKTWKNLALFCVSFFYLLDCMQTDSNHNELGPCAMTTCTTTYVEDETDYGLEDDWEAFDP